MTSLLLSQPKYELTYRGYSNFDYIETIVEDNKIISEEDVKTIVKSIGIRTLPNNFYFDLEKYKVNLTLEEFWQSYSQPNLYVNIQTFRDKVEPNKYSGHIEVNLRGSANSIFIEMRPTDYFIDNSELTTQQKEAWKKKWSKKHASYNIIPKGNTFIYATKSQIKNILRGFIQEIFDELNILIRDYP